MNQFRDEYTYIMEGRVEWADMDAFQHVNNTIYLRYFERVRMELLRESGVMDYLDKHRVGPILASTSCRFKLPLAYPDPILIGTRIEEPAEDSFTMHYAVFSVDAGRVAAQGEGHLVYYDYAGGGRTPIPGDLRQALIKYVAT
jgi:acyl-CoA thioester hydrolase